MERVSKRHEGDLDGRLLPFDTTRQVTVTVAVGEETARLASAQHVSWMLLNLLTRLVGIVREVRLRCRPGIPLAGQVVPLAPSAKTLDEALLTGAAELPFVPCRDGAQPSDFTLHVGPVARSAADLNVYGEAWWGGVFRQGEVPFGCLSPLPLGPYLAACLAASYIFKYARMRQSDFRPCERAFYSAWRCSCTSDANTDGPADLRPNLHQPVLLAGVGAVGSAVLHCLWPMSLAGELMIADNDEKGIEDTNLNRYPLFGSNSVRQPKASHAAGLFRGRPLALIPHDGGFDFFFENQDRRPSLVLSAVDKNTTRAAMQDQYPALIVSGATSDLRAEILRCGPPGQGACLRCFNPPEEAPTDEAIRAQLRASSDDLERAADTTGVLRDAARDWEQAGRCGEAGDRLLAHIRKSATEPERFAVGFVSVAAGVLLAAQLIKECAHAKAVLDERTNRAVFQFWNLISCVNGPSFYARQASCPKCAPGTIDATVWRSRYERTCSRRSFVAMAAFGSCPTASQTFRPPSR